MRALPRWRQISDDLLRRLQDGEFIDGFPGELALSERYEVSRGTIRQALAPLREQGIVGGGRGRPSYVINTSPTSGFGPMYSLREAITARGGTESSQVLAQRLVTSDEVATAHLDAMNKRGPQPWALSFSYGRALQAPALAAWRGEPDNIPAAQQAYYKRARNNGAAAEGRYSPDMEDAA